MPAAILVQLKYDAWSGKWRTRSEVNDTRLTGEPAVVAVAAGAIRSDGVDQALGVARLDGFVDRVIEGGQVRDVAPNRSRGVIKVGQKPRGGRLSLFQRRISGRKSCSQGGEQGGRMGQERGNLHGRSREGIPSGCRNDLYQPKLERERVKCWGKRPFSCCASTGRSGIVSAVLASPYHQQPIISYSVGASISPQKHRDGPAWRPGGPSRFSTASRHGPSQS